MGASATISGEARTGAGLDGDDRGRKLRVLLIAEACNPAWSSVPLIGYNLANALAGHEALDVTLVTHARNRPDLNADPLGKRVPVHYVDNEFIAGPAFKLSRRIRGGETLAWSIHTALAWPSYMVFERMVFDRFRGELAAGRFDLIHRITPVTPVFGSPLTKWTDVPMLIGPLNGGLPWPAHFDRLRKLEREWLIPLRALHAWLPYYASTFRRAAGVIAASRHTASRLPKGPGARYHFCENGVDPDRFPISDAWTAPGEGEPFRFITVGRLVPVKAIDLILRALAGSERLRGCRLTLVGDGPQRADLESLADRLGVGDRVEFTGWLGQADVAGRLRSAQAFVFPSVKEFGGAVVLEAMASALPAVVTDYGGPAEMVTPETGLRLPLGKPAEMVDSLQAAMETLAGDHALCRAMGAAAAGLVRSQYVWSAKARQVVWFYRDVLAARKPSPG